MDARRHCYLDANAECRPVSTLVDGDIVKGTRVYVDGKMAAAVRRKYVKDHFRRAKTSLHRCLFYVRRARAPAAGST